MRLPTSASVKIKPVSISTAEVPRIFDGWGSVSFSSPSSVASDEPLCLCAVSGTDEAGRQVIGVLDEPPPSGNGRVSARRACTFAKPKSMSHGAAAQLPLLALTAAAALHAVGLPPGRSSIGSDSKVPAHCLVAGSSGRLPTLLVQVLAARGVRVCVAAQDAGSEMLGFGASEVINHNEYSFLTALAERRNRPLDAVLDCVGQEVAPQVLREHAGAAYVSLAPPTLLRLCTEGAPTLVGEWLGRWGKPARPVQRVWVADALARESMLEVLDLIEDGRLRPPAEANLAAEVGQQYLEYVNWARDAETGLRWGFPGDSQWAEDGPSSRTGGGWVRRAGGEWLDGDEPLNFTITP